MRRADAVFSPDGRFIVGLAKRRLEIFDQKTFERRQQISSAYDLFDSVLFSPDGGRLLVRRSTNVVELRNVRREWDVDGLWELSSPGQRFAFSHDGKYLAATCSDRSVALFDVRGKRPLHELRRPDILTSPIAWPLIWIPKSHIVAIGGGEPVVHLWNVDTGTVQVLNPGAGNTWALAASPDGKTLAAGTQDGFIKLINLATLREIATLRGHLTIIQRMEFSPDGAMLISYGGEGIRLWRAARENEER